MKRGIVNKKGNTAVWVLVIFAGIMIAILGYSTFFGGTPQTIIGGSTGCKTDADCGDSSLKCLPTGQCILKDTGSASAKIKAYDIAGRTRVQVTGAGLYVWETDTSGKTSLRSSTSGDTITSSATSVSTNKGNKLKAIFFNGTTYGVEKTTDISSDTPSIELDTYAGLPNTKGLGFEVYYKNAIMTNDSRSLGVGASSTLSYDYFWFTQNETDKAFNFKGIGFDVNATSDSNISKIEPGSIELSRSTRATDKKLSTSIGGLVSIDKPERLRTTLDFIYALDQPVMMLQNDVIKINNVKITADSSGCTPAGAGEEKIGTYIFDEGNFLKASTNELGSGIEDDSSNHANVGLNDKTFGMAC